MNASIPACEYVPLDVSPRPIIGWRCWFVLPHEGLLRPIAMRGLVWKPRETMEAMCPDEPHEPPDTDCKCGIWSTSTPGTLEEIGWTTKPPENIEPLPGVLVVGQIALWGRCIEHERGWRASHAYPQHLYAFTQDATLAATLRDRYLVPVEYGEQAERLRRSALPKPPLPEPTTPLQTVAKAAGLWSLPREEPLPDFAHKCLGAQHYWINQQNLAGRYERERLDAARTRFWNARARGDYHGQGGDRIEELRHEVRRAARQVWKRIAAARAAKGDETSARRLVWLLMAERWRDAEQTYLWARKAERDANLGSSPIRRRPGVTKVSAMTLDGRRSRYANRLNALTSALAALAELPTPTYAEWCRMVQE